VSCEIVCSSGASIDRGTKHFCMDKLCFMRACMDIMTRQFSLRPTIDRAATSCVDRFDLAMSFANDDDDVAIAE
jgi:hypothetical protein